MTALWFRAVFFASPTHSNGVDVVEEKGVFPPLSVRSLFTRFDQAGLEGIPHKPQFLPFEVLFS